MQSGSKVVNLLKNYVEFKFALGNVTLGSRCDLGQKSDFNTKILESFVFTTVSMSILRQSSRTCEILELGASVSIKNCC